MMKLLARCAFLLVTVLWGSFYAVAKGALAHTDPIIFTFFEALTLLPIALVLLIMHRKALSRAILKRGILLGSCLCIATLTITVSETFTAATTTAFFPSTGGIFAAVIMATVFRRSLSTSVWVACGLSFVGILLIFRGSLSEAELRGDVIALIGALLFTVYLFLVEQDAQHTEQPFWALLGIEHLSLALWMTLFSLLFGDWQHFHPVLAHDIPVVLYVALACTFLPVILTHFAHRFLDPLETGFIAILEPLWGILIAHLALGEVVPRPLYIGGALILSGAIVQQSVTGAVLTFSQRMRSATTTLKRWIQQGKIAGSPLSGTSIVIMLQWNVLQGSAYSLQQRDSAWKARLTALSRDTLRTLGSLSRARIRFQASLPPICQAYYLLAAWDSLLPLAPLRLRRSATTDMHMQCAHLGWNRWKHWHENTRQRWSLYPVHGFLSDPMSTAFPLRVASSPPLRWRPPSHRCRQERHFQSLPFPRHACGHLIGVWCTAPPG